jgi:autotransporter-associated beta strand protein
LQGTGTNDYTGGTTIRGGLINFDNAARFGTGDITLNGGGLQWASVDDLVGRQITLGAGGGIFDTNNKNINFSGSLTGGGSLTKEGEGILSFLDNTAFGSIARGYVVNGGELHLSNIANPAMTSLSGSGTTAKVVIGTTTLTINQGINTSFAGEISGGNTTGNSLIKTGSGTLTLTGKNIYTGNTLITGGTLDIGGALGSIEGNIVLENNANVTFSRSNDYSFGGYIWGRGSLTKNGSGTLTLGGPGITNSYTGGTIVNQGTLKYSSDNAFVNDSAYTVNGGKLDLSNLTLNFSTPAMNSLSGTGGEIALGAATLWVNQVQGVNTAYGGAITGTGGLTKDGAGTLTLSGNNTYTGGTTVSGGILQIGYGGTTGSITGNINNNTSVVFNRSNDFSYTGSISGVGTLTKDGGGTLTLVGVNTYTGRTIIEQGTLLSGVAGAFVNSGQYQLNGGLLHLNNYSLTMSLLEGVNGNIQLGTATATQLTVNQGLGVNTTYGGAILGAGSLTKNGAGTLTLTGKNAYLGGTTVINGTLAGNTDGLQGSIVNDAALEFNQAVNGTFNGSIRGTGNLTKNGTGTVTISGNASQANFFINSGTLSLARGSSLTASDDIRVAAGAGLGITVGSTSMIRAGTVNAEYGAFLNVNGYTGPGRRTVIETLNGITGDFTLYAGGQSMAPGLEQFMNITLEKINSDRDLVVEQSLVWNQAVNAHGHFYIASGTFDLADSLSNNVNPNAGITYNWDGMSLTKTGAGTLRLSANNTYTGRTSVSTGTLEVTGRLGGGSYAGAINISNNATLAFNQSDNQILSGIISGSGDLIKDGLGTLTLTGANVNTGSVRVLDGILEGGIGADASLYLAGKAIYDGMGANRYINALDGSGSIVNTGRLTVQSGVFSGDISGSASLEKTGLGTLTLTGKNTYTGNTTVSQGTLIGNTDSLKGAIGNSAFLEFNQAFNGTYFGNISGDTGTLTVRGTGEVTVAGNVSQGSVVLNRNANLNITAGHTMTVGGDITVGADARLSVSAGSSPTIIARSMIAAPGAVLNINGYAGEGRAVVETTNGISNDFILLAGGSPLSEPGLDRFLNVYRADNNRTIRQSLVWNQAADAHGTFNIAGGNNFTLSAPLDNNKQVGAGTSYSWNGDSLHKIGTGTLTLTGENTYSGGTIISAGTLQIGDGGTTGSIIGNITNNANVTFNRSNAVTYGGVISGDGSLTKDGEGTLTLTGSNVYIGGTVINAGTLAGNIAPGADLTIAAGAAYDGLHAARSVNALKGDGRVVNNAGLTVRSGNFSGIIGGGGGLVKAGEGTLILGGANTYTGLTEVRGGTLALAGGRISDTLTMYGGTALDTGGGPVNLTQLDLHGTANWRGNLNMAGRTMNFYLPDTMAQGGTMLTVSGEANIVNSTVNVDVAGDSSPLQMGDTIVLINANSLNGTPVNGTSNGEGMHGVTLKYNFHVTTTNNRLLATVTSPTVNEQTKALSTGFLGGGLTLTRQGSGLIDWRGISEAVSAAWRTGDSGSGSGIFAALAGGAARYDMGSRMDLSNVTLMAGLAWGEYFNPTRLTFGTFFEYGSGSYDAYDSFAESAPVRGAGDASYFGGGLLGRMDNKAGKGNFYTEASLRAGVASNEYVGSNMGAHLGRGVGYDSSSIYFGLHFGTGYLWNINDKTSFDVFGKHFWTRHQGDSVKLTTGDPIEFGNVDSQRLRVGGRLSFAANGTVDTYAGAAGEYEYAGNVHASTNGFDMDAPSLRGGTFVGEFGVTLKLLKSRRPLLIDLGMRSYGGKTSGVMGTLRAGHDTGAAANQFWGNLCFNLMGRFEF